MLFWLLLYHEVNLNKAHNIVPQGLVRFVPLALVGTSVCRGEQLLREQVEGCGTQWKVQLMSFLMGIFFLSEHLPGGAIPMACPNFAIISGSFIVSHLLTLSPNVLKQISA